MQLSGQSLPSTEHVFGHFWCTPGIPQPVFFSIEILPSPSTRWFSWFSPQHAVFTALYETGTACLWGKQWNPVCLSELFPSCSWYVDTNLPGYWLCRFISKCAIKHGMDRFLGVKRGSCRTNWNLSATASFCVVPFVCVCVCGGGGVL